MAIPEIIASDFKEMQEDVKKFLFELTAIPSVSSDEAEACEYVYQAFSAIPGAIVEKQFIDNSIMEDPYWNTGPYFANDYTGHYNVIVTWPSDAAVKQPPVYANAHIDTVMACGPDLMPPKMGEDGDTIHGLGVHDDKGHVAMIYGAFRYLSKHNIRLPFDFIGHLVVEEEIGGNGSLWAVRQAKEVGQAVLMLDGNEGVLMHQCRGCIWPRITTTGISSHPGDRKKNVSSSAYDFLVKAIADVEKVHDEYVEWLKDHPVKYFEDEVPPFNIGMIHAGNWPATTPTEAFTQIVFGVFPSEPDSNKIMRKKIEAALAADPEIRGRYKLEFTFDVLAGGVEADDPLTVDFRQAMIDAGYPGETGVFNAACDIGFYSRLMGAPAINVGDGTKNAHSKFESIKVSEVCHMSQAIMNFLKIRADREA